jgi:predicted ATP-grasp superfamily ATP-dependent carboligase
VTVVPGVPGKGAKEEGVRDEDYLLLAGASVRAAAFAALRAGLRPWCVDLFADADLRTRCPVQVLPPGRYPDGLVEVFAAAPPGPWMYTGALENRPRLVRTLSHSRPLWGTGPAALCRLRRPVSLGRRLRQAGIPCPAAYRDPSEVPRRGRWLLKTAHGAGGRDIAFWKAGSALPRRGRWYFQEFIEGQACSAVYLADGRESRLLGVTRQLVGESWLRAAAFHYCGSVGPISLPGSVVKRLQQLGRALGRWMLRGLFGVDFVLKDGIPYPVEVNPRYTASMEIVELATGTALLALHRRVFELDAAEPVPGPRPAFGALGKAILFAPAPLSFPEQGPWTETLRRPGDPWQMPAFADIPLAGTHVAARRPVLTFFAGANAVEPCLDALRTAAVEIEHWCLEQ